MQEDYIVDNGTGAVVRGDINRQLQAIATLNSGTSAPVKTYPGMLWLDLSDPTQPDGVLRMRNQADSAWLEYFANAPEFDAIQEQVDANTQDIADLQARTVTLEGDMTQAKADISANANGVSQNASDIAALDTRLDAAESKNTQQDASLGTLGNRVTAVESDVSDLQAGQATNASDIAALDTRVDAVETKNGNQDTELSNLDTRVTTLETSGASGTVNVGGHFVGEIFYVPFATVPAGCLKANGAAISRTTYKDLFAAIGTTFGAGDGSTTFNVPDLRGEFLRGWDDARGVDTGRVLGSAQAGGNASHAHGASAAGVGDHTHGAWTDSQGWHGHGVYDPGHVHMGALQTFAPGGQGASGSPNFVNRINTDGAGTGIGINGDGTHSHNVGTGGAGNHSHTITVNADGGTEARPRNVAMLAVICYKAGAGGDLSRNPVEGVATAGMTDIVIPGGFKPGMGMLDVTVGGATLNSADFDDTDGVTIKLKVPMAAGTAYRVIAYASNQTIQPVPGQLADFRNDVINGDFTVWQRGPGPFAAQGYSADCWFNAVVAPNAGTVSQVKRVNGNHMRYVWSGGGGAGQSGFWTNLESVGKYSQQTRTLSFRMKADAACKVATYFDFVYGTGGSNADVLQQIQVHDVTNVFQTFRRTVTVPDFSGKTIGADDFFRISFMADNGTVTGLPRQAAGAIEIQDIQWETGSVATNFERRPPGMEQTLCQRFVITSYDMVPPGTPNASTPYSVYFNTASSWQGINVTYPVTMRKTPAVTAYSPVTGASGMYRDTNNNVDRAAAVVAGNVNGVTVAANGNGAAQSGATFAFFASAEF